MKTTKIIALGIATIGLAACGGGGSSSGGGSANGKYVGGTEITYTYPDNTKDTERVRITITVAGNTVTVADAKRSGKGKRNGNRYSVPFGFKSTQGDITCTTALTFDGTLDGALTYGSVSGKTSCRRGSAQVTIPAAGTFQANKQTSGKALRSAQGVGYSLDMRRVLN